MDLPAEYLDREQTFFKHQVLRHYLRAWSQKLASVTRTGRSVRLWYVDCFAGPWESHTNDRADTSGAIGLSALEEVLETHGPAAGVEAGAIFVEANPTSARTLREFLDGRPKRGVSHRVLDGEFGARVSEIASMIASDAAFVFVDPTGWKGAGMDYIAPLIARPFRDVMINVMFHHLNRWKDDRRKFLRDQMRDFFGLGEADLPAGLDETELMALYRRQLAQRARLEHVADLAVPHPSIDRTFFRLVVGGHHPEVLRLFRDIEEKVVGRDAGEVRQKARARVRAQRTRTLELALDSVPSIDFRYRRMQEVDLVAGMAALRGQLKAQGPMPFGELWPPLLGDYHITRKHLADAIHDEARAGLLKVTGMADRERTIKDEHVISVI